MNDRAYCIYSDLTNDISDIKVILGRIDERLTHFEDASKSTGNRWHDIKIACFTILPAAAGAIAGKLWW